MPSFAGTRRSVVLVDRVTVPEGYQVSVLHGRGIEVDHAVAMVRERDEQAHPAFYADPDRVLKFEELSSVDANVHGIYRWLDKRAEARG